MKAFEDTLPTRMSASSSGGSLLGALVANYDAPRTWQRRAIVGKDGC